MKKLNYVMFCALLIIILFSALFFSDVYGDRFLEGGLKQHQDDIRQSLVSGNVLDVAVSVYLAEHYGFFDLNVRDDVVVDITMRLAEPPTTPHVISATIRFFLTGVTGLPPGANYTYGFWGAPPVGVLEIYLPANVSYSSAKLRGYMLGSSVLWKNTAEIHFLSVTSSLATYDPFYTLILVPPHGSKVLTIYSHRYPNIRGQEAVVGGKKSIVISEEYPRSPIVVLYQPEAWETYGLALILLMIFVVCAIPYVLKYKIGAILSKLATIFQGSSPSKLIAIFRRLYDEVLKVDSSKFLAMYILFSLLMISLSLAAGPSPGLKVYVLATRETAGTISELVHREVGGYTITMYDEMNEFKTLADLGVFSAVIVGDFSIPIRWMTYYIYPALDSIPYIIILKSHASGAISSEIQGRYAAEKIIFVDDLNALGFALRRISKRGNVLGLNISPAIYNGVSAFVGLSSFIIVFFGLAFLACKLVEIGKKPGVGGVAEAITYAVLYFVFTQIVHTACSVLLGMPLGLHASSPKVTAVGFLGFGGGCRPRTYVGLAGFIIGAFTSLKGGLKLDKMGLTSFLVLGYFVLINSLTSGIVFYEFVLNFTVGPTIEYVSTSSSYVREFLGTISSAFGGWVSPVYTTSTGIMVYYTGAIPFCLFPKLKKSTATVLLLFCAFFAASGGIRVAEMMPWRTIASIVPGIMTGLFVAAFFCLLSFLEMIVREKIEKKRLRIV